MAKIKRHRAGGHAWWDKRITRFFRKNFPKKDAKNLRLIYLALCEIDSDFVEQRREDGTVPISGLSSTVATYALVDRATASKHLQIIRDLGLVEYKQVRDPKTQRYKNTHLVLWAYDEEELNAVVRKTTLRDTRGKKNPYSAKSTYKNSTKVLTNNKNLSTISIDHPDGVIDDLITISISKPTYLSKRTSIASKDSIAQKSPLALLSKWLDHNVNLYAKGEEPIAKMKSKLFSAKIQPLAKETLEILEYWNSVAHVLKSNGRGFREHRIEDSKVVHMAQIIVTGLLYRNGKSVDDIKRAIDGYGEIMEKSRFYYKNKYSFPYFFSNSQLFSDCMSGDYKTEYLRKYGLDNFKKNLMHFTRERLKALYSKGNYTEEDIYQVKNYEAKEYYENYLMETKNLDREEARKIVIVEARGIE